MNIHLPTILIIILILYSAVNFYIGIRGWQTFSTRSSPIFRLFYLLIFGICALSYPLGSLIQTLSPSTLGDNLTYAGSFWLGMIYYLLIATLFIDLLRVLHKYKPFLPKRATQHPFFVATVIFWLTTGLILYGTWNARHPVTMNYEITIPKTTGSLETLQVVMVSDIHLGKIIDNRRLTKIVNRINQLEPDIVLIAGDIIDNQVDVLPDQNMIENFSRLHPKLGTYAILGNHEYFDKQPDRVIQYMEQGNVHILRDQWAIVANSFYVVGRDDVSKQRYTGIKRQDLASVMMGIDHSLPILLLDHQPTSLEDAVNQGVDLQLSGHTHLGQLFPNNLITKKLYELDWGYLSKENLQVIVSCGVGTWGPPIRIGNRPEIINLTIHFVNNKD
ncbi:metallophosphoesterase [Pelosinus sp. UFO1]|uniref:metallophosphoesterase n=1 Tax=Pelosinus sp. UFO1 TaxID=484770 RepID=UPI0004D0D5AA|nr:metallophosphoesterase [Pelosinus sp. UFO1]AIF49613.1 Calcineurin-like phosphoesterase superfamily domain containing protein [Pelosinus sp. UFO1]